MWKRDTTTTPTRPTNMPSDTGPVHEQPTVVMPAPRSVESPTDKLVMNLGKSIRIKGEISASEDMTLYGQMEGRISLNEHTLTIGPDAEIRAEITASTVVVMGVVLGNVSATKKIDVRSTGSVTGDIAAPRIVIADGGVLLGKVQVTGEKFQKAAKTA
ncbi:MAG TPA: polymer-forming cytoskeletal protein [Vicinamibacterales bacterium]